VAQTSKRKIKARLRDAFRQTALFEILEGADGNAWLVEISSRRMGIDNGKDTIVHIDQILERTLAQMTAKAGKQQTGSSRSKKSSS
jgi:hypothetical protein